MPRTRNKKSPFYVFTCYVSTYYVSIQTKLLLVFLATTIVIFGVNMYMYFNINRMIANIDTVYESNAMLNELQSSLTQLHRNMESFLDTRDTESLEGYLRCEQEYREQLYQLNRDILGDENKIAEKNICNMSERYMSVAEAAIEAKRGRNVVKYKELYEKAVELCGFTNSYIYSLNNRQFQENTNNYRVLFVSIEYSERINIAVLCMVSALNITLVILLTRGIINPLKRLAEAADEVAKGTWDIELSESETHDEIGTVTRAFNQMIESLRDYIGQVKKSMELESALREKQLMMETHLKDAQLKYLQAQINPHFLFNTMNAGAQLAMLEGADKTYTYVQNVADFFRYNVKKNNDVVTLREEIELVDSYIYIINVRFAGDIHFRKKIDEDLINVWVPSMILQPLIENSINYGIREIEWESLIELSVYRDEDGICVSVRDNGIGMPAEKIEKIMDGRLKSTDLNEAGSGVGLDNVINRLRIYFDKQDVVKIISAGENMGTEVVIYISEGFTPA